MADIQALPGLRYDLTKVGSLSEVVAPPYDVIDQEMQNRLYERNPYNVIRLILNRGGEELGPGETVYDAAARHFKNWRRDGILKADNPPAVYVYHQTFEVDGRSITRRGYMARVRIEPFGEGTIYPHEETHSKAKEDRFRLMMACGANLSPIFSVYPDEENEVQTVLENAIADQTPIQATDDLGVVHKLWLVNDPGAIAKAAGLMGDRPLYIADGHHRYETACNIRQAMMDSGEWTPDHPCNYVLMTNVGMSDPGMIVLPTHRLFRGLPAISSEELVEKIGECFDCEARNGGPEAATSVWEEIAVEDDQGILGLFTHADGKWTLARLNATGKQRLEKLAPEHSDDWRSLGVAVLHRLLIEDLLGGSDLPSPLYVHSADEVAHYLNTGDAAGRDATGQEGSGEPFPLAALVMPATLEHVRRISEHGERMPAKSTYFYPKLLSGLVINPIR